MGLLPHSVRTTSCPLPYGRGPGFGDAHSCAVFVSSFVITSSSQSSAISSKPVPLSLVLSLSLSLFHFFCTTQAGLPKGCLWFLWQSGGECRGRNQPYASWTQTTRVSPSNIFWLDCEGLWLSSALCQGLTDTAVLYGIGIDRYIGLAVFEISE